MKSFFERHWKAVIIGVIAVIFVAVAAVLLVKLFTGGSNGGKNGIATIEAQSVGVFDTKDDAAANPIVLVAGSKKLTINGRNAKVSVSGASVNQVSGISGSEFDLNLGGLSDGTQVLVTIKVGGDGSFVGERFGQEIQTHYLMVNVSNPGSVPADIEPGTAPDGTDSGTVPSGTNPGATTGVPTGTVHFGDTTFQTYGSEAEAQAAVASERQKYTIPTAMAKSLVLTAEPLQGTARIWASVCMVDSNDEGGKESRMNADSNWTATFDLSEYAGHQVTIVLKAEDSMALNNGYSYVSFFVPQFEEKEEYIPPVVVPN